VETDCFSAGQIAARHLVDCGHRNIAFLTSPLTKSFRQKILVGVKDVLSKAGRDFSDSDVFIAHGEKESNTGLYEFDIGKQLTETLLQNRRKYTAIIAINDITAFGVIQALTRHGLRVPDDVSVIGFDNILFSEMISPPLTTVEMPSSNMGYTACRMIISAVEADSEDLNSVSFKFPYSLKERSSTKMLA